MCGSRKGIRVIKGSTFLLAIITDETGNHPQQFDSAAGQISPQISPFVGASS
jgi:hypothetical protein